jgi:hypothetical protein
VASRSDEVEQGVDTIVAEAGITLDSGLFCEDGIVLSLKVADDFAKGRLIVDLVAEARGVDNGQRDSGAFLIDFELCGLSALEVVKSSSSFSYRL